jgi:hypothetical protein
MPVDVDIAELDCILGGAKIRGGAMPAWLKFAPSAVQSMMSGGRDPRGQRRDIFQFGASMPRASSADLSLSASPRAEQLDTCVPFRSVRAGLRPLPDSPQPDESQPSTVHTPDKTARELALEREVEELKAELRTARAATIPRACIADIDVAVADDVHAVGSVDDMERCMLASKATAARAAAARAKGKACKRPAAAILVGACKRPAAAMPCPAPAGAVDMHDVWAGLERDYGTISYGAFTSRAYDSARRKSLKRGHTNVQAKAFAKSMYTIAVELYEKLSA